MRDDSTTEATGPKLTETLVQRLGLPAELKGLDLDPERARRRKVRRVQRLETVTIPNMRFVGFGGLSLAIYAYLQFFAGHPEAARIATLYFGFTFVYAAVIRLVLPQLPRGFFGGNLPLFFLAADVIMQIAAIYLTGGEESWLMAVLLLRMADQATTSLRRAVFFTHFNALCFLALIAYLAWGEGRDINWPREATKAGLLYAAGWWISITARGGDLRRRRVSASVDATRRVVRELETQARHLDEAKARAELASQAKSQFLANMSHELRTPLSAVVGTADLLAHDGLSASQREYVELLQTSAESVLHLIDDILDFSKVEADRLELNPEWTRLRPQVDAVVRLLGHRANAQKVRLSTHLAELPEVRIDPARFRQVLLNLVGNAIKFTPDGSVDVRLTEPDRDSDQIRIRVEVADTGIGIRERHQQSLFEPFTQADASMTRRHGGTGLGLAIARRLVELMGGEIGVTSRVGQGSTFWFELYLPWRDAASRSAEAPQAAETLVGTFEKPRVLLAEDNPINSQVASAMLESLGAVVARAEDGRVALDTFRRDTFDLVLMDCSMPVMDGYQATGEMRRWEQESGTTRRTPIIALTAHALAEERAQSLAAGMDDHLAKPIRRERLARLLAEWTRESSPDADSVSRQ